MSERLAFDDGVEAESNVKESKRRAFANARADRLQGARRDRSASASGQSTDRSGKPRQGATPAGPRGGGRLGRVSKSLPAGADGMVKRVEAGATSILIFWSAIAFYIPQLALWVIGIGVLGLTSVPVLGWFVPGNEVYMACWFIIAIIGVCTMVYSAAVFMFRRIDCFSGWKGLIFILCLTGYLVFFINFAPWYLFWLLAVTLMQGEQTHDGSAQ